MNTRNQSLDVLRGTTILIVLIVDIWSFALIAPRAMQSKTDFSVFYDAALRLRHSTSVYKQNGEAPFIHPAYEAVFFLPFTCVPLPTAYWLMVALNTAIVIAAWRTLNFPHWFLAFPAFWFVLETGTDSILFLACIAGAWIALSRNRALLSGVILGLGAFRFQDLVPLVLLLAIWKEWKIVKGFIVSLLPLAAISCLLESPAVYMKVLLGIIHQQPAYLQPVERMTNLRGMLQALVPSSIPLLLPLFAFLVLLAAARLGMASSSKERFAIAAVSCCLVSYHCYLNDLVILSIPVSYCFAKKMKWAGLSAATLVVAAVSGLLNVGIYLSCFAVAVQFVPLAAASDTNHIDFRHFLSRAWNRIVPMLCRRSVA